MGAQQHGHVFGQAKVKSLLGCGGVEELLMKLGSALWVLQKQQTQGIALNTTEPSPPGDVSSLLIVTPHSEQAVPAPSLVWQLVMLQA